MTVMIDLETNTGSALGGRAPNNAVNPPATAWLRTS